MCVIRSGLFLVFVCSNDCTGSMKSDLRISFYLAKIQSEVELYEEISIPWKKRISFFYDFFSKVGFLIDQEI